MKRRIIVTLVFVLAIGLCGGLVWFNFFRDKMITQFFANMQRPPVVVTAADVEAREWTPGISAIGTARAENGVELAVQIGGLVKRNPLQANDKVKKGDVSGPNRRPGRAGGPHRRGRGREARRSQSRARTTLKTARVQHRNVLRPGCRPTRDGPVSPATIQAVIDQKALKAPFSGVIGISRIDPGQYLQVGTQVATLQDLDTMKVDFTVPEQVGDEREDRAARSLRRDRRPTCRSRANHRHRSACRPADAPGLRPGGARENNSGTVMPGQFLHVRIDLPAEPNVLTVPQTAVVSSLYGDYVFVAEDNTATPPKLVAKQFSSRSAAVKARTSKSLGHRSRARRSSSRARTSCRPARR